MYEAKSLLKWGDFFFFKWDDLAFCGSELNGSNLTIGNVISYLLELSRVNRVNILVEHGIRMRVTAKIPPEKLHTDGAVLQKSRKSL